MTEDGTAPETVESAESHASADQAGTGLDDGRLSRRDALRKTAAGAAVVGAVWAGPRVEGLSLVPDYASAGTASGITKTFTIDSGGSDGPVSLDADNGGAGTGCDGGTPPIYGNDWAAVSPASNPGITVTSPQPNARNQAINMDYLVPVAGDPAPGVNVDVLIPSGWDADLNVNRTVAVAFTVDPPFNKCRVQSVSGNRCDGNALTTAIPGPNPAPGATNPGPFTTTVQVPGPQPSNMAQLRITIECT